MYSVLLLHICSTYSVRLPCPQTTPDSPHGDGCSTTQKTSQAKIKVLSWHQDKPFVYLLSSLRVWGECGVIQQSTYRVTKSTVLSQDLVMHCCPAILVSVWVIPAIPESKRCRKSKMISRKHFPVMCMTPDCYTLAKSAQCRHQSGGRTRSSGWLMRMIAVWGWKFSLSVFLTLSAFVQWDSCGVRSMMVYGQKITAGKISRLE